MMKNKACFADRDGVIIAEKHFLNDPDQIELIPGVAETLIELRRRGYVIVIVSNQSGVARGLFGESEVEAMNARLEAMLREQGAGIDRIYYCPHHPDYGRACECRKPAPGMLLKAARELEIDLNASFMVGDRLSDLQAADAAGCKSAYLVKTGYGLKTLENNSGIKYPVVADFSAAVADFLAKTSG